MVRLEASQHLRNFAREVRSDRSRVARTSQVASQVAYVIATRPLPQRKLGLGGFSTAGDGSRTNPFD